MLQSILHDLPLDATLLGLVGAFFGFALWLGVQVAKVVAMVGAVAVVARGQERLGPLDLRGVRPPPKQLWIGSLAVCVVGAALTQVKPLSELGELVVRPGMRIARDITYRESAKPLVAALVASAWWALLLAGARALPTLLARREQAKPSHRD